MIQYFRIENGRLHSVLAPEDAEIVRLVAPDGDELEKASSLTSAPLDLLSAACDKDERPRFESDEGAHLVVLRVPHVDSSSDIHVTTVAIGVVLTASHVISICSVDSTIWNTLNAGKPRIPPIDNRIPFLCAFIMCIARLYLKHLEDIRRVADSAEREIHFSMRNETLIRMLNLASCLVYFTTSLRGHEPIWPRLKRVLEREMTEDEKEMLEDVQVEFKQAHDLAEIHSNILSGMMDAFASVISNNLNVVMKLLTSITIILMLPTLIASVYGMNVKLPFQDSPHAFLITMGMALVLSIGGVVVLFRKKFF